MAKVAGSEILGTFKHLHICMIKVYTVGTGERGTPYLEKAPGSLRQLEAKPVQNKQWLNLFEGGLLIVITHSV